MKGLRLKALFLNNEDLYIGPPEFLNTNTPTVRPNTTITDLSSLRETLRGRKLRKNAPVKSVSEDEELVKGLSFLRNTKTPQTRQKSILARRLSFRQSISPVRGSNMMNFTVAIKELIQKNNNKLNTSDTIDGSIQRMLVQEKNQRVERLKNTRRLTITHQNIQYQQERELKRATEEAVKYTQEVKIQAQVVEFLKDKLRILDLEYQEKMQKLTKEEVELVHLLHKFKQKKFSIGQEDKQFIQREKIRQAKQILNAAHQKETESVQEQLKIQLHILEELYQMKRNCKMRLQKIKEGIVNFYCNILKQGMDIREDGIRWAIKAMWKINEPVPISMFPKFIDDESAYFLLKMTKKDLKLDFLNKKLEEIKKKIRKKRPLNSGVISPHQLMKSVQDRLKLLSRSTVTREKRAFISKTMDTNTPETPQTRTILHQQLNSLKSTISSISQKIKNLQKNQIERVALNFQKQGSSVKFTHILYCLLGNRAKDFKKHLKQPQ